MKKVIFTLFVLLVVKFLSAQCNASFTFGGSGQNIIFTNNSTPDYTKAFWDFGDGTFSNDIGTNVSHNYSKADYYLVKLTIYHPVNNCHDDTTILVLAGSSAGLCKANFTYVVNGNQVTFTSTSNGSPNVYLWEFGDGSISTLQNPVHIYTAGGFYNVRLRIFVTTMPVCMDAFEKVVKIGTSSDCRSFFNYLVTNDSVYFYDKSIGQNLVNYKWNFGDGTISTDKNPVKKYSNGGFYDVCLSVWDNSNSCFNTGCRFVPINTNNSTVHASFDYYVNATRIVNFRDNSTGSPTSWHWDFGDGSTGNTENVTRLYAADGYYLVHLRASNSSSSSDYVQLIKVGSGNPGLKAMFAFMINNNYYPDASVPVDFKGTSLGDPSKMIWNYGDGDRDSSHCSPYHIYADTGRYNVCVTIKNSNTGQSDTYCKEIHVIAEGINETPLNNITLFNSPNPVSTTANISYFLPKPTDVSLVIYDLIGNKKEVLVDKSQTQGVYAIEWDRKTLPNGLYLIELKTMYGTIVNKLTIVE